MKTKIVVLSRDRARWLMRQNLNCTIKNLGHEVRHALCVRDDDDELGSYVNLAKEHGSELSMLKLRPEDGWAETMDTILELAIKEETERLIVLDDDLLFNLQDSVTVSLRKLRSHELERVLSLLANSIGPECPHMSMPQVYNRSHNQLLIFCKPMMTAHILYVPHYAEYLEHRFSGDEIKAYGDFRLSLRELTSGFLNCYFTGVCLTNNFNAPGGCSVYRTMERQWEGARHLARDFPDFVILRDRHGWQGNESAYLQKPSVKWRSAFNRDKFIARFNEDPSIVATRMLQDFENAFSKLMEELRTCDQQT